MPTELRSNSLRPVFSLLIIDDSEEDRYALRRLLRRTPSELVFDVREADTGARGLALCRERLPDCVLLDYGLGDTDGLSLLAELNAGRAPDDDPICPVVILTGAGVVAQVAVRALRGGAQDYLVKETLTPAGIALAIESAVEKVRLRRELRQAEARFRTSLDNMLDSFALYSAVRDPESGGILDFRCEYVNEAACRSNRLTRAEQMGRLLRTNLLPARRAYGLFDEYVQVVESGESLERTELILGAPDAGDTGASLEGAFDIRAWKMGDGCAVTWRDVTVLKRLEADRERRVQRDRNIAAWLQDALTPPIPANIPGLALTKYYEAALDEARVGGDFYDVFPLAEGCTALVVGDLTGKGLAAAAQVATVHNMLRYALYRSRTVVGAVQSLNSLLTEQRLLTGFATLFVGAYDSGAGRLTYVNCGQEPALVRRAAGAVERLAPTGPVLGVFEGAIYEEGTVILGPGDALAVFTDGLTEVGPSHTEMLGIEGIEALLRPSFTAEETAGGGALAEALALRLIAGVETASPSGVANDDLCILVAVAEGGPPAGRHL